MIDDYVSDREAEEEEDWLYLCRRKGVYNGPPGGPPGLNIDDEYPDPKKAVRFRRLCDVYQAEFPELPMKIIYLISEDQLEVREEKLGNAKFEALKRMYIESHAKGVSIEEIRKMSYLEKNKA